MTNSPARVIGLIPHENIKYNVGDLSVTGDIPEAISTQHQHIVRTVLILGEIIGADLQENRNTGLIAYIGPKSKAVLHS